METLLDAVRSSLEQDRDLLAILDDQQYTMPCAACFNSTIGAHIRHNLDHFGSFLAGVGSGRIDYEARDRDERIASDRHAALVIIENCITKLEAFVGRDPGTPVQVREESDHNLGGGVWLMSSLGRELQFLLGHTVHHNALIATIAHGMNVELPVDFGVAPSTRRFQGVDPNG